MSPDDPRHGTQAGRTAHQRAGQTPCQPCQDAFRAYEKKRNRRDRTDYRLSGYSESDGLGVGEWVFDRKTMTQRWVSSDPTPPPSLSPPPKIVVSDVIACTRCHTLVDQACRTAGGLPTGDHKERRQPRHCMCGGSVVRTQRLCDECRLAAIRKSQREAKRRQRAARRQQHEEEAA